MSASNVVVAPMLIALVTAIATLLVRRYQRVQASLTLTGAVGYVLGVAVLARQVFLDGPLVYQVSNWPAPFGISLVADELSVFVLAMSAVVHLASTAYAVLYVDAFGQRVSYHPLVHFMILGVTGAVLTGDLFNLFVWFEVMLMPSYLLVVFYSGQGQTRAALQYTVLNLIGSAVMLVAIGGLYATTGTLNMADMARRLANAAQYGIDPRPVLGLAALLFAVFALKAGIVPFQFWVPDAYRAAPAPVSALLAGVTKKVGIYAIVRLLFSVFAAGTLPHGLALPGMSGQSFLAFFGPIMFVLAGASIVLGGLGAVTQPDLDGVFAHSSIGQVGFIVLPLAVAATVPEVRTLAIAAALVYSLNHAVAKSLLFLASGTISEMVGTVRLAQLGGLSSRAPWLSGAVFVAGLALVGIPPLAGFFGKLLVFKTATDALSASAGAIAVPIGGPGLAIDGAALALALALGGAILTIAYVSRFWNRGFWGGQSDVVRSADAKPALVAIVAVLAVVILAIGIGFDPVYAGARAGGDAAIDWEGYVDAVDPTTVEAALSATAENGTGNGGANATGGGHEAVAAGDQFGGSIGKLAIAVDLPVPGEGWR